MSLRVAADIAHDSRLKAHDRAQSEHRQRAWRRNLTGYLFIAPWLIAFLSFTAIPITASAFLAFTNYNVLSPNLNWVGLDNFNTMAQDQRFWRAVRATFLYVFAAVPLKLLFALGLAMLLNKAR